MARQSPSGVSGVTFERLRDSEDLRDLLYQPALVALPLRRFPHHLELDAAEPSLRIREQGKSAWCTGFALAALIDIQRVELARADGATALEPVSAQMLFRMGQLVSAASAGADRERLSLRSALKGFYHNGVCLESDWGEGDPVSQLTVERARSARHVGLGTYYRLRQYLPDYHSALVEAGAIVVSARLHRGWSHESLERHGRIVPEGLCRDAHAFVVIGYDASGFYVLNSWGRRWAGRVEGIDEPVAGVAHWSYRDWADSIMDAWVLRLAVPTPDSFEYSVGAQGHSYALLPSRGSIGGPAQKVVSIADGQGSEPIATPRQRVIGHYVHMADGVLVSGGSYPDSEESLGQTLEHIVAKLDANNGREREESDGPFRVCLRIPGDTGDVDDAMRRIAVLRRRLRHRGIYPLSIVWNAALTSAFSAAMQACIAQATRRMPDPSDERDDLIEALLRPIGRPLWRQMRDEADAVAAADSPFERILCTLNAVLDESARRPRRSDRPAYDSAIELVVEGAGALVLTALLDRVGEEAAHYFRHVRRIHLAFPVERSERLAGALLRCMRRRDAPALHLPSKFRLYHPTSSYLDMSTIGAYTRTWFHLVNNSFDAERIGEGGRRIVALDPDPFRNALSIEAVELDCQLAGREVSRRANRASMLRWYMVSEEWLGKVLG